MINLSDLRKPALIQTLGAETKLAEHLDKLQELAPDFDAIVESDPAYALLQLDAYFREQDAATANYMATQCLLAYAENTNLDHLAASFGVERLANETDPALRQRVLERHAARPTAGPATMYRYYAMSASGKVADVFVDTPEFEVLELTPQQKALLPESAIVLRCTHDAGLDNPRPEDVAITVLSNESSGIPDRQTLDLVTTAVTAEDVRPMNDRPRVMPPEFIDYRIDASIAAVTRSDVATVLENARSSLDQFTKRSIKIGGDITVSGIIAALKVDGVFDVTITTPKKNVTVKSHQVARCTAVALSQAGTGF